MAAPARRPAGAGGRLGAGDPTAKPQGGLPTLKMPTARGRTQKQTPMAARGLKVNAFATGLKHPRWIYVLPNRDVLVAESPLRIRSRLRHARICGDGHGLDSAGARML